MILKTDNEELTPVLSNASSWPTPSLYKKYKEGNLTESEELKVLLVAIRTRIRLHEASKWYDFDFRKSNKNVLNMLLELIPCDDYIY